MDDRVDSAPPKYFEAARCHKNDIGLIVFFTTKSETESIAFDMLLISSEIQNVKPVVCFTKRDLTSTAEEMAIKEIYEKTLISCFFSAK